MPKALAALLVPISVLVLLSGLVSAKTAPDLAGKVRVRVEKKTYPVSRPDREQRGNRSPEFAAKLKGKDYYTTDSVLLENQYLRLTVLPEFGGRLVRAVYKPTNRQLFWEHDAMNDGVSWSMGGGRWSFPFWEHGRHFDETGGYAIVRHSDGSVTLAVDMRFEDFLTPEETRRYGRATCLRLAQFVRLAPDEAAFTWTARVDNPLPIRYGFKLWYLLRQPSIGGVHVIMPAAGVTNHNAPKLEAWNPDTRIGGHVPAAFAIAYRHDFAGWYFPKRDLNVLRIADHTTAPGAKQVLYPPDIGAYVELWGGNHEVFEECGRMLPAFGAFDLCVKILAAEGIGPADFANSHAAVSCRKEGHKWHVAVAPTRPLDDVFIQYKGNGATGGASRETLAPDAPLRRTFDLASETLELILKDAGGNTLVKQTFPIAAGPMPEKEFAAVQDRTRGTMAGGKGLFAELTDLATEHSLSLPRAAAMYAKTLAESDDVPALLDAARRLMRTRKNSPQVRAGLDRVLAKRPRHPWANLYKAMWLIEAGKDAEAAGCLAHAKDLPGGRYLGALAAAAKKDYATAQRDLQVLLAMRPDATFSGPDDPSYNLMQPGAFVAATRPRLLLAIVQEALGKKLESRATLEKLVQDDPALIEAWMLLGDKEKVRTLTAANPSGRRAAERTLGALRAGRWRGIGRP